MDEEIGGVDRAAVGNEEVGEGVGGTDDKLGDLEEGEDAFKGLGSFDVEGGEGVVGVLRLVSILNSSRFVR